MRVLIEPRRINLAESDTFTLAVTITNTSDVIGGYRIRILGIDPSWVRLPDDTISLFPSTTDTITVDIHVPRGVGAGDRRLAVQVTEITPPHNISVTDIELVVPPEEAIRLSLTPMTITCGKRGRFSVLAENTGNTAIAVSPLGMDPEAKVNFHFTPAIFDLAPGEHLVADLRISAKRRWFGSPVVRPFGLAAVRPKDLDRWTGPKQPGTLVTEAAAADRAAGAAVIDTDTNTDALDTAVIDSDAKTDALDTALDTVTAPGVDTAGEDEAPPERPEALAQGVIVQKPRLGRGVLSLLSLLLAVSVFAAVITIAMARLVGVSAADRDLALQVAAARTGGAVTGSAVLGGTVNLLTDGTPASGVAVDIFAAGDLTQPIISTATADDGAWVVSAMPAGSYKLRFRGAGFAEVWFPNALSGADAKSIDLDGSQKIDDLETVLGGLPAVISGQVKGDDVSGAILTVAVPQEFLQPVRTSTPPLNGTLTAAPQAPPANEAAAPGPDSGAPGADGIAPPVPAPGDEPEGSTDNPGPENTASTDNAADSTATDSSETAAVLRSVPIGSDGLFILADLPSPAVYDLTVTKPGFAAETQRVDLDGGETRDGVVLLLRTGDGLISGTVTGPNGPIGNAVITATGSGTTVRTLSLTKDDIGGFTLRGLITPATYTVTVTSPGYTAVTSTLSLTAGQKLDDVLISLEHSSTTLSGTVTTLSDEAPASGVSVTVASGDNEALTTVTQSGSTAGSWSVSGLSIPGTFTITFSRSDLQSQTVAVAVNSAGQVTSGAVAADQINVAMRSAYASITGIVSQDVGNERVPVGRATITLSSGENSYTVTSASQPASAIGRFEIGRIVPGTYTLSASSRGTSPTTVIVTVTAGQQLTYHPVLVQPASVSGTVTADGAPLPGVTVEMYLAAQYPATTYATTITDAEGRYSFHGVDAPQAYVIAVRSATTGPLVSGTIVLEASQAGVLDLAVPTEAGES